MKSIQTTIWSSLLQTTSHLNVPFTLLPSSTLNEKLNIQAQVVLTPTERPGLRYLCIGNGGHRSVVGVNGFALIDGIDHEADHAAMYKQIPFVLRALDNDLSAADRAGYALRNQIVIDGRNYIAYYAKRINTTAVTVNLKKTVVADGISTTTDYVTSAANLNPVPPVMSNTGSISTSGEYLSTSSILSIPFNEKDVTELINVAKLMYNDERYAVISEFAFCTGVDRNVQIDTLGGSTSFKEAVGVQIATFVTAHYELIFNTKGFDFRIEAGAVEPLLGAEQISTAVLLG
jgi:hypothetical protein